MSIRIVRGEIGSKDVTTRTILPNPSREVLAPFDRIAETIATPKRRFPPHRHEGVEVLIYVIEGSAIYEHESGGADSLVPGATRLLTAPISVAHSISPSEGTTVRWFAAVAKLPDNRPSAPRLQAGLSRAGDVQPDGTIARKLIGPGSGLTSAAGLECVVIGFDSEGTSFHKVGHSRVAVGYAFAGSGAVDNETLEQGEAALVEGASGVALRGTPGFSVILVSAPRPPAA
jgi:redox-sensitive bicupin YhaK (pirin superfamily)